MADILTDINYYRMLEDRALIEVARDSDNHLIRYLADKWVNAKNAYSDEHAEHAEEVDALEKEISDLESQNDALANRVGELTEQLNKEEDE